MANIYELTEQYQQFMELADDPDVEEEVFFDTWEAIDGEFEDKADSYAKVMKNLENQILGLKAEIDRLSLRKRTIENNISRMKMTLQRAMEITEKPKFKTDLFSFNIQANPPSVFIADESRVPEEFLVPQPPKVDKTKIKDWLKEGNIADWAELTQSKGLRIR